jgi:hypothetical protein
MKDFKDEPMELKTFNHRGEAVTMDVIAPSKNSISLVAGLNRRIMMGELVKEHGAFAGSEEEEEKPVENGKGIWPFVPIIMLKENMDRAICMEISLKDNEMDTATIPRCWADDIINMKKVKI